MSNNESTEMYLETIYILEKSHGHAHGVDIANRLGVSKASVSKAMNYLKAKGFINKESYGTITLTNEGKELSKKIYRNHQMLTQFLKHSLELTVEEATINACRIEHVLDDKMIEAIKIYLEKNNIKIDY